MLKRTRGYKWKKEKGVREQAKDEKKEKGAKIPVVSWTETERCGDGKQDVMEVVACQNPPLIRAETDASGHSKSQAESINT